MHRDPNQNIAVTGSSGFIGKFLLHSLITAGYRPLALARTQRGLRTLQGLFGKRASYFRIDLKNPRDLNRLHNRITARSTLIHLAAVVNRGQNTEEAPAAEQVQTNVIGLIRLINSLGPSLNRVIHVGTADVYGFPRSLPITEQTPLEPSTHYAATRIASEWHTELLCRNLHIPLVRLRLAQVYGPGDPHRKAIPTFIEAALSGKDILLRNHGKARRQYIHVQDVGQLLVRALHVRTSTTLNVAGNEVISMRSLANLISQLAGRRVRIKNVASTNHDSDLVFDTRQLTKRLRYSPNKTLSEGLREQLEWASTRPRRLHTFLR